MPRIGPLSAEATRRLALPSPPAVVAPDPADHVAVGRWRERINRDWLAGDPPPADVGHLDATFGQVRCLVADRSNRGPVVVYFHGGGFALGSPEVSVPITDRLAGTTTGDGCTVVSVDYRLSPEHPYPAAVQDGRTVFDAMAGNYPARPVVLAGDSAGATIAVTVALGAATVGAAPAGLVLFSPLLDLRPAPNRRADPRSEVDEGFARWLADSYRGHRPTSDPAVSPLLADLSILPPTLIQVGTRDNTLGGATQFAQRANHRGANVTLDVWDGLWHTWHYHRGLPEADDALAAANRFISELEGPANHSLWARSGAQGTVGASWTTM